MLNGDELTLVSFEEGLKQVLRLHPEGHRVSFSSLPLHGADQRVADAHLLLPKEAPCPSPPSVLVRSSVITGNLGMSLP